MADDLAARRAKLFGAPAPSIGTDVLSLMALVNEAHAANASLMRAMQEMAEAHRSKGEEESDLIQSLRAELSSAQGTIVAQAERCARAEGELAALRAEHERMCSEMESEPETEKEAPEIDTAALISALVPAIVSAIPKPPIPAEPKQLKAWVLDTKDSMGNPRRVRLTPEF